jgi:hypothetical protein
MLESGRYGTVKELTAAEKVNLSYLCRVLRLTLLAPEIVEAILDGQQHPGLTLPKLMLPFSVTWNHQMRGQQSRSCPHQGDDPHSNSLAAT